MEEKNFILNDKEVKIEKRFTTEIGEKKLIVEAGKLAGLADGSVTVQYGETVVLATAVMSDKPREGMDYFPLLVDYEERLYAAGKIKGSRFIKREGRPTDEAIVTGRLIDRTIRPLFDERLRRDVQVVISVLSVDGENDPDIVSIVAASLALAVSDIPWQGPIGAIRISDLDNKWFLNPTYEIRQRAKLDLIITGTEEKINMIEASANEVQEEGFFQAVEFGRKYIKQLVVFQKQIVKEIGREKRHLELGDIDPEVSEAVNNFLKDKLEPALYEKGKKNRTGLLAELEGKLTSYIENIFSEEKVKEAKVIFDKEITKVVHENILKNERRSDGRGLSEIRPISTEVGLLPRTHGSGLFRRGETQVLSIATLGAPGDEQLLDSMEEEGTKYFMHHYNFPPFSVGEVAPMRGPGRREIGHGALAEKALIPVIPDHETFPYTIRLVSEVLSSNGSSSMASVCASSLALMDAGIPIKAAVAGIAMGLMADEQGSWKILTDIQGPEDHQGDMDFKVAGTKDGITAVQMDVKTKGIDLVILKETLKEARRARMIILEEMNKTIIAPRKELSKYAPRITTLKISPEKIRDVIGPGGRIINEIIEKTGVTIDIEDDGLVMITSKDAQAAQKAVERVKELTREVKPGEIFKGQVKKIMDFGAFVEILPGQEGLVHISEMAYGRVNRVENVLKLGEIVQVKVKGIDEQGRISLTLKGVNKEKYK